MNLLLCFTFSSGRHDTEMADLRHLMEAAPIRQLPMSADEIMKSTQILTSRTCVRDASALGWMADDGSSISLESRSMPSSSAELHSSPASKEKH